MFDKRPKLYISLDLALQQLCYCSFINTEKELIELVLGNKHDSLHSWIYHSVKKVECIHFWKQHFFEVEYNFAPVICQLCNFTY